MTSPVRAPWDQPFADTSFFNIGIGTGAQWDTTSAAAQQLHSLNGVINTTSWSISDSIGTASDPLVSIQNGGNTPSSVQMRVDPNAQPTGGTDMDMAFFDETQPWLEVSTWDTTNTGNGVSDGYAGVTDTTGNGLTAPPGYTNSSTYNYGAGVINSYDLSQGAIDHMLRISISANDLMMPAGSTWDDGPFWPNDHVDYDGPSMYTGSIPAGATFGIPASVNLNDLGLSQGGLMLAKALQDYGAYWNDSAGTNEAALSATPDTASNPLMQEMESDFQKLVPYLAIMTNQGANNVNGGGQHPYEVTTPLGAANLDINENEAPAMNVGTPASANNTIITQQGQTIIDSSGNNWQIYNGEVELNSVLDASSPNTVEIAYVGGKIWQEQSGGQWQYWLGQNQGWSSATTTSPVSGTGTPASGSTSGSSGSGSSSSGSGSSGSSSSGSGSASSATPSANDTVITVAKGSIIDASGNTWAITSAGSITENGVTNAYSYNVTEMAYVNGTVYQENTSGQWYEEPSSGWWTAVSNPLPASTSGTGSTGSGSSGSGSTTGTSSGSGSGTGASFTPSPNNTVIAAGGTITDATGNLWTINSSAQVLENGNYAAGTANVIELAYENGTIWQENSSNQWWSWNASTKSWGPTATGTSTSPVPVAKPTLGVVAPTTALNAFEGVATPVTGVSVSDSNATETATFKITASAGTLAMTNTTAGTVTGSGTSSISVSGTAANINADLAHLTYSGSTAGATKLSFAMSDAAGAAASASEGVTVKADTLTLQLSEDAYLGNADFIVKMDGTQIGGPTAVTALHSANATQTFSYAGNWGGGTHSVEIDFTNDAYGGSPSTDRNLYVNQVSYNGAGALSSVHALDTNGAFVVKVGS